MARWYPPAPPGVGKAIPSTSSGMMTSTPAGGITAPQAQRPTHVAAAMVSQVSSVCRSARPSSRGRRSASIPRETESTERAIHGTTPDLPCRRRSNRSRLAEITSSTIRGTATATASTTAVPRTSVVCSVPSATGGARTTPTANRPTTAKASSTRSARTEPRQAPSGRRSRPDRRAGRTSSPRRPGMTHVVM